MERVRYGPNNEYEDEQIEELYDDAMRELFGGAHPYKDEVIILKARKHYDGIVEVYAVGKWRSVGRHKRGCAMPSNGWIREHITRTLKSSCGEIRENSHKPIELLWVNPTTGEEWSKT
jgi:hypothetical protein